MTDQGVSHDPTVFPDDLPVPKDDGAADHLTGMTIPSVPLTATDGTEVDLATMTGTVVVYIYPRTGQPGQAMPAGWDEIPGARGCTPQSCGFRDHHAELKEAGADAVFGLSTQDSDYQREARERLQLPFELLSDSELKFAEALRLPTFLADGMTLIKRMALILRNGRIEHVFYPVFPPDRNAQDVLERLRAGR